MKNRNILPAIARALADTPVVLLNGARQTGKTTLARALVAERPGWRYWTLDDAATLAAAATDPAGFVAGVDGSAVIDEVQKAPELFPAIKLAVDRDRRPGRFLLTGSVNVLLLPKISESLAGRIEILTLYPFSQGEIEGRSEDFVDALFSDDPLGREGPFGGPDWLNRALKGGLPEPSQRSEKRRDAWFASYVTTVLHRDVRDMASIHGLRDLPRLLSLLAARAGGLVNRAEISRASGLPYTTLERYLTLLEAAFLLHPLPAWSANLGKRLTRSPKIHLCDTALLAHLLGLDEMRLREKRGVALGQLLENFVVMELRKQSSWSRVPVSLHHFRTAAGSEVDLILEDRRGRIVGVEVKAAASLGRRDAAGLKELAEALPGVFHRGVILYGGETVVPLGARIHALPVGALWRTD